MLPLVMRFSALPSLLCRPALGGRRQPQLRAHRTAGLFRRGGARGVRVHPGAPGPAAAVGPALTPHSLRLKPHHRQHSGKSQTLAQGFAWTEVASGPRSGRGAVHRLQMRGRGGWGVIRFGTTYGAGFVTHTTQQPKMASKQPWGSREVGR